ncbi:hypothetical protein IJX73_01585 [bacterium]|nr:hypothetical protein [bacterium]MBQ9149601.1 hypothetical protein [bacterium]
MTQQVYSLQNKNEQNAQVSDSNRFLACEEIVDELVEQGLPKSFVPENFISRIQKTYGISYQEARTCLRLAVKQLEASSSQVEKQPEEKLYAQSGYFYPQGYTQNQSTTRSKDGMDSLSSLGSYNRLMFGLR